MVLKDKRDAHHSSSLDKKYKSLKGGVYRGGYRGKGTSKVVRNDDDLNVAFAPSGFKGRSNSHRSPARQLLEDDYWEDYWDYYYYESMYADYYEWDDETAERWDGEQGPYTYSEFYEYYGNAEDARGAWGAGEAAQYSQYDGRLLGLDEDDLELDEDDLELDEDDLEDDAAASAPPQVMICDLCCEPTTSGLKKAFSRLCRASAASAASAAHSDGFCSDCVQNWIGAALDEDRIVIRCPATGCDERMSRRNVKNGATKEQFAVFEEISTRDYSAKYDEIMADPALAEWASAHAVQCPHCLQLVNRSAGCNHMACACGESFCYSCGGKTSGEESSCKCRGGYDGPPATLEEQQLLAEVTIEYARELKAQQTPRLADSISDVELLEWRVDGTDGFAYPRAAFIEHYGSYGGLRRWVIAGVVEILLANSNVSTASNINEVAFRHGFQGHSEPWRWYTFNQWLGFRYRNYEEGVH